MEVRFLFLIFLSGFIAAVGQILVLRELLVLFHGNELSTGLVLACWLLWTAAGSGLASRFRKADPPAPAFLITLFTLLCLLLPMTLVWLREARVVWSVSIGELITPGRMFLIALTSTAPFCFISGALFALAWSFSAGLPQRGGGKGDGTGIYLAEAAGAAIGGLSYYFILLPLFSNLAGSLVLGALLIASACLAVWRQSFPGKTAALALSLTVAAVLGFLLTWAGRIDNWAGRAQWGPGFVESRDTPYHNLAFLRSSEQYSLFCNGLWLYSTPDPQTAEPAAHLPLLQHPKPERVLVTGDFSLELVAQMLKHPGIKVVDWVRQDPESAKFAKAVTACIPLPTNVLLCEHFTDPKRFLSAGGRGYDVIVTGAAEPVNAEMNRFYTVEFFSVIKAALNPNGVFSFGITSAHDIIGPRQAQLLKALKNTLDEVFPTSFAVSGEGARFVAGAAGAISNDPMLLADRLQERKLDLQYLRDYHLFDWFNPIRLAYMESVLGESASAGVNRDFEPVCYRHALGLWGAQLHPALGAFLGAGASGGSKWFPGALGAAVFVLALAFRAGSGRAGVITLNTAVAGAVLILLEIVLILVYQIVNGAMYKELALIISLFMAGMAAGAGLGRRIADSAKSSLSALFFTQALLAAYTAALAAGLALFRGATADSFLSGATGILFALLAFVAGGLGGGQFSLAVSAKSRLTGSSTEGAGLYAADLIGAAGGAVIGSLFIIPVFGIPHTLMMLALACLAGSFALLLPQK
ncbi:MAG: hypothetical protein AB9866_02095 [Syntrophobacteraceae bacterium]